ncbi:MAG: tetratricopeptide (TPR) repeat protein [Zhongshania aliphaticivorans]|jgi:tetratricopeptide (TPR) repeat protein
MREKDFLTYNREYDVRITGGRLWKIPSYKKSAGAMNFDERSKELSIFLRPDSEFSEIQGSLYALTKKLNPILYLFLWFKQRIPSLLLLVPIALTVAFIGFITVWGDLVINWVFLGENAMTVFGMPMNQSAVVCALIAIALIYFFPVIFSGEQEGFIKALNERFSNREQLRKRLAATTRFLKSRKYVTTVEVWNPDLSNEELDWVERSLIPALFDAKLKMVYHIRVDERHLLENYINKIIGKELVWEDQPVEHDDTVPPFPIGYEYLEAWEKSMLAVYVFASTASLSSKWLALKGTENDGFLNNVVSIRMVKIIVGRFKERLFSEKDLSQLISVELFASRCLNDYGILSPALRYNNDVWAIREEIVAQELQKVKREMRFMISFLQTEMDELTEMLDDPVAALKLNSTLENNSIYNKDRLAAIRFFVKVTSKSEQYKIFKQYWHLIIKNPTDDTDLNEEIYRIIGVELLLNLTTIFERAGMYKHATEALNYVEPIFPFKGRIGKARIKEREGNFKEAVITMVEIREDWKKGKVQLKEESSIDLNLDIAWAIVSGRLEDDRAVGREAIGDAQKQLSNKFDTIRNSNRTFRLYNILANYEEWEGSPKGALDNYDKALQIPGVHQTGLSNLFVNKGIALRQMQLLEESILYGEKGVEMKTAIGDADQLPIALHNLAQTYIELAFSITDKEDQAEYFSKAVHHAQDGLDIQNQTGSVKKRGQLLAEKFMGQFELTKLGGSIESEFYSSLEAVKEWLQAENEAGRGATYDCTVVVNELLGSIAEFQGNTLEDALAWQSERA